MNLRRAVPGDAAILGDVHTQAWRETYAGFMTPAALASRTAAHRAAQWRETIEYGDSVFVVLDRDGIAGFGMATPRRRVWDLPHDGFIDALYVLRRAQGRGFGRALMDAMARTLAARGCRQAALWVIDDNAPAIGFYRALGGQEVLRQSFEIADWSGGETAFAWTDITRLFLASA